MKVGKSVSRTSRTCSPGLSRLRGSQEQLREDRRADVLGDHQRVAEVEGRGLDGAAEEPQRVIEEVAVVVRAAAVGHDDRHPLLTARPPGPLPVVRVLSAGV